VVKLKLKNTQPKFQKAHKMSIAGSAIHSTVTDRQTNSICQGDMKGLPCKDQW
jgi:hypothetical protein